MSKYLKQIFFIIIIFNCLSNLLINPDSQLNYDNIFTGIDGIFNFFEKKISQEEKLVFYSQPSTLTSVDPRTGAENKKIKFLKEDLSYVDYLVDNSVGDFNNDRYYFLLNSNIKYFPQLLFPIQNEAVEANYRLYLYIKDGSLANIDFFLINYINGVFTIGSNTLYSIQVPLYTDLFKTLVINFKINADKTLNFGSGNITIPLNYILGLRSNIQIKLYGIAISLFSTINTTLKYFTLNSFYKETINRSNNNFCNVFINHLNKCSICCLNSNKLSDSSCMPEYVNLSPLTTINSNTLYNFSIDVDPVREWEFTIDFWYFSTFPSDFSTSYGKIIYKDFMSFALGYSPSSSKQEAYCIPYEFLYSIENNDSYSSWSFSKMISSPEKMKWMYVKCGFSLKKMEMYFLYDKYFLSNNNSLTTNPSVITLNQKVIPNKDNSLFEYKGFSKKYYKSNGKTTLILKNFYGKDHDFYIRNLNILSIYMDVTSDWRYMTTSTIKNSIPYVILIPFKSDNTNTGIFTSIEQLSGTSEVQLGNTITSFCSSLNFKRFPFLEKNQKIIDNTLTSIANIEGSLNTLHTFYDDNKILSCGNNQFRQNEQTCQTSCQTNKFRQVISHTSSSNTFFCNNSCLNNLSCPENINNTSPLNSFFICNQSYYLMNDYSCVSNNESNVKDSSFQFSGTLQSAGIKINIGESLLEYVISVWIHPDLLLYSYLFSDLPSFFRDKYLFLTNSFSIQIDMNMLITLTSNSLSIVSQENPILNWMKLLIVISPTRNKIIFTINNNLLSNTYSQLNNLENIYFCSNQYDAICNKNWIDGYYKDLRIFKTNDFDDIAYSDLYLNYISGSLLLHYSLQLNSLSYNTFTPKSIFLVQPTVSIDFNNLYPNYDNNFLYNVGNMFSIQSYFSDYLTNISSITKETVTIFNCSSGCKRCYGSQISECYECEENYILTGSTCSFLIGMNERYVYKHSIVYPNDIEFNFSELNQSINNQITIFMFIRIKYINQINVCLIVFTDELCLFNTSSQNNMKLKYVGIGDYNLFDLGNFDDKWKYFSISTFKSLDSKFKSQISMTFNGNILTYLISPTILDILISKIVFKKNIWRGNAQHITVFNSFIINPYSFIKTKMNLPFTNTIFSFKNIESKSFKLRSSLSSDCINASDILNSVQFECEKDYNPYLDFSNKLNSDDDNNFYVNSNYSPVFGSCCSNFCIRENCHYVISSMTETDYMFDGCDFKKSLKRRIVYSSAFQNTIRCHELDGINLNRYKSFEYNLTPDSTGIFTITFYFKPEQYNPLTYPPNQIKFSIIWENLIHISIERVFITSQNKYIYKIKCNGLSSTKSNFLVFNDLERVGLNIGCSIDAANKKNYLFAKNTSIEFKNEIKDLNMPAFVALSQKIIVKDESSSNLGFLIIKDFSILKCYNCYISQNAYDIFYFSEDNNGIFSSNIGVSTVLNLVDKDEYYGNMAYNIINNEEIPTLYCNTITNNFEYIFFNEDDNTCLNDYNLNLVKNSIIIDNTPFNTRKSRFTVAFWVYIEDPINLNDGFNINYEGFFHYQIGKDSTQTSFIKSICLPSLLPSSPSFTSYTLTQFEQYLLTNSENYTSSMTDSNWSLQVCSVSEDLGFFYINNEDIKRFEPNYSAVLGQETNILHLKNFNYMNPPLNSQLKLSINNLNSNSNFSRVYIKEFSIFSDYIPKELYNNFFFMKEMGNLYNSNLYHDLISLHISFNNMIYNSVTDTSQLTFSSLNNNYSLSLSIESNNNSANRYSFPSSYSGLYLCNRESEKDTNGRIQLNYDSLKNSKCIIINILCLDTNNHCLRNDNDIFYFWCGNNEILNMSSLLCQTGTTTYIPFGKFDYLKYSDYSSLSDINCSNSSSMIKFYYQCMDKSNNPSIYFSSTYSFGDIKTLISPSILPNPSIYSIELWFYLDLLPDNPRLTFLGNRFYILIVHPHTFYYVYNSLSNIKLYYKGQSTEVLLDNILLQEWNHLFIRTTENSSEIFLNFNNQSTIISKVNIEGIFFCHLSNSCKINNIDHSDKHWANIWYRKFKIYDVPINLDYIRMTNIFNYDSNIMSGVVFYIDFQIEKLGYSNGQYLFKNLVNNQLLNDLALLNYDSNRSINISNEFDYVSTNSHFGKTVINNTKNLLPSSLSSCNDPNCKRCYSTDSNKCYLCNESYFLDKDNKCLIPSGKFLKSSEKTDITLNINNIDLTKHRKLTICLFSKIIFSQSNTNFLPFIEFNSNSTNKHSLLYKSSSLSTNSQIKFMFNSKTALIKDSSQNFISENWNFYSFSIQTSQNTLIYKNNLLIQVNRQLEVINYLFNKDEESILIDKIVLKKDVSALFAEISVYSSFIKGPFGLYFSNYSIKSKYRILYFQFVTQSNILSRFTPNQENCILPNQVISGDITSIICISDYDKYFDTLMSCATTEKNIITDLCADNNLNCTKSVNVPLEIASFSNTNINSNLDCTCFIQRHSYLISDDLQCRENDSINLAFTNDINLLVKGSNTQEMTMEFWIMYHSYVNTNFYKLSLLWEDHLKIELENVSNTQYKAKGIAHASKDSSKQSMYLNSYPEITDFSSNLDKSKWQYIRLSARYNMDDQLIFYTSANMEIKLDKITSNIDSSYLNLIKSKYLSSNYLVDFQISMENTRNPNFGIVFLREVRLYSSHLFSFYDTRYVQITLNDFGLLNNYFKFDNLNFQDNPSDNSFIDTQNSFINFSIKDEIAGNTYVLSSLNFFEFDGILSIPTGIYKKFTICQSGEVFNGIICVPLINSNNCSKFYANSALNQGIDTCIKCSTDKFLHADNKCYSTCPEGYIGKIENRFCRRCHLSCLTCNGLYDDDCLTCPPNKLKLKTSKSWKCLDTCPNLMVLEDEICKVSCEKVTNFINNGICEKCNLPNKTFNQTCIPDCPPNTIEKTFDDGNKYCILCDPTKYVIFNSKCTFYENLSEDEKIQYCISLNKYYESGKCVYSCSSNMKIYNFNQCISDCPIGFSIINNKCVQCSMYINNNTCIEKCPEPLYPDENKKCVFCNNSKLEYIFNGVCEQRCEDKDYISITIESEELKCSYKHKCLNEGISKVVNKKVTCLCNSKFEGELCGTQKQNNTNLYNTTYFNNTSTSSNNTSFSKKNIELLINNLNISNKTTDEIINLITEILNNKIITNSTWKYSNSNITINKIENLTDAEKNRLPILDLKSCENELNKNKDSNYSLSYFSFYLNNNTNSTKEYNFLIKDNKGNTVNTSICKNITIKYPLDLNDDYIKEFIKIRNKTSFDIFDPDSPFFTDQCTVFDNNNTDMTIQERKSTYNKTFVCSNDCKYNGVDTNFYVKCVCNTVPLKKSYNYFTDALFKQFISSNFNIFLCYKNINLAFLFKNKGFLLFAGMFLTSIFILTVVENLLHKKLLFGKIVFVVYNDS